MYAQEKAEFSLIPILFSIGVYVFVTDQVYVWTNENVGLVNTFSAAMSIGSILMGFLSDSFSRRTMLLLVHLLGAIFLTLYYFHPASSFAIFALGLIYNPLSIVRANLIDNLTSASKIKLISLSFIVQFFPETLFYLYSKIPRYESLIFSLGALFTSLSIGLIFFFDRRDFKIKKEKNSLLKIAFFLPLASKKALLTFAAFIPTQIAYFISDNLLEVYSLNPLYYSILSFGSLIGACMSILYKKTPHEAILTVAYGLSLAISALPVGAIYFYQYDSLDIPFMFVVLGSLLGFYIPFVYDIILHFVEKHYRGTACGILDFAFSGSSLITLVLFKELSKNLNIALLIVAVLFMLAVTLQRLSEKEV